MTNLNDELESYARSLGVDLFGTADLASAKSYIKSQGGKYVASFPRSITLGMKLLDEVIDQLHNHSDLGIISVYQGLYATVNASLDKASYLLVKMIQDKGYRAYNIPASSMLNNGKLEAIFSHKVAASLSGLGWIGKNCLLITPEYGPRVRLATVLTDAPLTTGTQIENRCGNCTKCTDICPSKAILGRAFSPEESRDLRLKAELCDSYTENRITVFGDVNCGLCVYVCPHGNKRLRTRSPNL